MELKWVFRKSLHSPVARSNRTFMELKLGIPEEIIAEALVLIAPLWN